jgi:hypothetical protein
MAETGMENKIIGPEQKLSDQRRLDAGLRRSVGEKTRKWT